MYTFYNVISGPLCHIKQYCAQEYNRKYFVSSNAVIVNNINAVTPSVFVIVLKF